MTERPTWLAALEEDHGFRRGLSAVLIGAALLRLCQLVGTLLVPGLHGVLLLDSQLYHEMAGRIAAGDLLGGDALFTLAPLYPYVLAVGRALFGESLIPLLLLQQAIALGSIALTAMIGRRCFGGAAGLAAACLFALYGAAAMLELKLMATTLAIFTSQLALLALLRSRERDDFGTGLLAGLALGIAALVRPNLLLFVPLAVIWHALGTRGGRPARFVASGVLVAGIVVAIAPVTIRNHHVSGEWVPISAQAGGTLYQANHRGAIGVYSSIPGMKPNPRYIHEELQNAAEADLGRSLTRSEVDRYWTHRALRELADDPAFAAALIGRKLLFWLGSDEISTEYVLRTERELVPTLWLLPVPFGVVLGLAVLGIGASQRRDARVALLLLFIATNLATVLIFYFSSRYRAPAVPVLAVLAGHGLALLLPGARRDGALPDWQLAAGVLLAVASLYSWSTAYSENAANHYKNLGIQFEKRARMEQALECYERAVVTLDEDWVLHARLAEVNTQLGNDLEAERHRRASSELQRKVQRQIRRQPGP
jgi:4-amino-4-deoxy-L-arabinose transferase-like glycosyltransferase